MVDGFILNNQLTDFSFSDRDADGPVANRVQPGRGNGPTALEAGRFPQQEIATLRARGHTVRTGSQTSSLQGIERIGVHGVPLWLGGAAPRREGVAKGD
jgi:gamma-glutamyltranspeptidase